MSALILTLLLLPIFTNFACCQEDGLPLQQQEEQQCGYTDVEQGCNPGDPILLEISGTNSAIVDPRNYRYLMALQEPRIGAEGCFFHTCGASLITPNIVMTAGHCVSKYRSKHPTSDGYDRSINGVEMQEGELFATRAPFCRHQNGEDRIGVKRVWLYPEYDDMSLNNDIALLELEREVEGPYLSFDGFQQEVNDSDVLMVVGWGATDALEQVQRSEYSSRRLRKADNLKFIPHRKCEKKLTALGEHSTLYEDSMLCAQGVNADACRGDSGGPLILLRNGEVYLYGIVSWGPDTSQCYTLRNLTAPGVYTRVLAYKDWIYGITQFVPISTNFQDYTQDEATTVETQEAVFDFKMDIPSFSPSNDPSYHIPPLLLPEDENKTSEETIPWYTSDHQLQLVLSYPQDDSTSWQDTQLKSLYAWLEDQAQQQQQPQTQTQQLRKGQVDKDNVCSFTAAGCACINGQQCSNPNNDLLGSWCEVDRDACDVYNVTQLDGDEDVYIYGYCSDTCTQNIVDDGGDDDICKDTLSGCVCKDVWMDGSSGRQNQGCANPDSDSYGNWCQVDVSSCPNKNLLSTWQMDDQGNVWDFCVESCRSSTPSTNNDKTEQEQQLKCTEGGCLCLPEWQSDGATFKGCSSEHWCIVMNPDECNARHEQGIWWDDCDPEACPR